MIELTKEAIEAMTKFKQHFGDIVPLNEIPASVSTIELVEAINRSITKNHNFLPEVFGYGVLDEDKHKRI